jgi:hypothetical protein
MPKGHFWRKMIFRHFDGADLRDILALEPMERSVLLGIDPAAADQPAHPRAQRAKPHADQCLQRLPGSN